MPPIVPPHREMAKRRMQWGLDPRVAQFSQGRQVRQAVPHAMGPGNRENTGQEHRTPTNQRQRVGPGVQGEMLAPIPGQPGGPVIPLGGGTNTQAAGGLGGFGRGLTPGANPRSGQDYQAYEMGNREYHNYGGGNVVSFERQQSPQLKQREATAQAALLTQLAAMQSQVAAKHARQALPLAPQGRDHPIAQLLGIGLGQSRKRRSLAAGGY